MEHKGSPKKHNTFMMMFLIVCYHGGAVSGSCVEHLETFDTDGTVFMS